MTDEYTITVIDIKKGLLVKVLAEDKPSLLQDLARVWGVPVPISDFGGVNHYKLIVSLAKHAEGVSDVE